MRGVWIPFLVLELKQLVNETMRRMCLILGGGSRRISFAAQGVLPLGADRYITNVTWYDTYIPVNDDKMEGLS